MIPTRSAGPPSSRAAPTTALLGLLAGCAACATVGPSTTARTLDQGKFQVEVRQVACLLELDGVIDPGAGHDRRRITWSLLELGVQYGVTDRFEFGARLGSADTMAVGALRAKVALHRAATPDAGYELTLAPGLSLAAGSRTTTSEGDTYGHQLIVELPLLAGFNLSGGSQVIVGAGPAFVDQDGVFGYRASAFAAAGLLGFAWKAAPGVRLMPVLLFGYAPSSMVRGDEPPSPGAPSPAWRTTYYQASLSFLMGGD